MKYLKLILTIVVILGAVSGAVATKRCYQCSATTLYYFNGTAYVPAGEYGWDFYCDGSSGVCAYYRPDPYFNPNYYAICRYGIYTLIPK